MSLLRISLVPRETLDKSRYRCELDGESLRGRDVHIGGDATDSAELLNQAIFLPVAVIVLDRVEKDRPEPAGFH